MDDEAIISLVSTAKMMGIANEQIDFATRGAIGLANAFNMDVPQAMKMTAMAMEGEYSMLAKQIPALKTATTEYEKAVIVQKAMAVGFSNAEKAGETLSGAVKNLGVTYENALETIGESIAGKGGLVGMIDRLREKINELSDSGRLEEWGKNTGDILRGLGWLAGKTSDAFSNLFNMHRQASAFWGNLAANIVNPKRGTKDMFGIIGDAGQETIDQFKDKPLIGTADFEKKAGEAKIAREKEANAILEEEKLKREESGRVMLANAAIADSVAKKKVSELEIDKLHAIEIRKLESEGNEAALKDIQRRMELKKAASLEEMKALKDLYALEDKLAAGQKVDQKTAKGSDWGETYTFGKAFAEGNTFTKGSKPPSKSINQQLAEDYAAQDRLSKLGLSDSQIEAQFQTPAVSGVGLASSALSGVGAGETAEAMKTAMRDTMGDASPVGQGTLKTKEKTETILSVLKESKTVLENLYTLSDERMGGVKV
jgi:hypothetical protein